MLEPLARSLEPAAVRAGGVVVRQGDDGDRFYVIAGGEADATIAGHVVATLRRGDGFGEIALLANPRAFSEAAAEFSPPVD
jgi:CRP-like cAMP-binding protein